MSDFKKYRKKGIAEMRTLEFGEDLTGISISEPDLKLLKDSPKMFYWGYLARNPDNPADQWYVALDFFNTNYVPL